MTDTDSDVAIIRIADNTPSPDNRYYVESSSPSARIIRISGDTLARELFNFVGINAAIEESLPEILSDVPEELIVQAYRNVIRQLVATGSLRLARDISGRAIVAYPKDDELQAMASILAPPRIVAVEEADGTDWRLNRAWLKENWKEYRGYLVALLKGELLEFGESISDISEATMNINGVLITRVN